VAITQDQEELMRRLSAVRLPAAALPRSCCRSFYAVPLAQRISLVSHLA
jgi:hypothetical protein